MDPDILALALLQTIEPSIRIIDFEGNGNRIVRSGELGDNYRHFVRHVLHQVTRQIAKKESEEWKTLMRLSILAAFVPASVEQLGFDGLGIRPGKLL